MAGTGFDWVGFSEHDAMGSVANDADDTSPELDLDGKAACQIGLTLLAADTVVDDIFTVYVLGTVDGTLWEDMTNGSPWAFTVTIVQDTTVAKVFMVDPKTYPKVKIGIKNASGPAVTVTIDVNTATVPVAS